MNRIITFLAICMLGHSLAITPQAVDGNAAEPESSCLHDSEAHNAVTTWPGDSCAVDITTLNAISSSTPYPLSCPPNPQNSKCFPITEADPLDAPLPYLQAPLPQAHLSRKRTQPPNTPTPAYEPRSITLRWPDGMHHAIFYADDACMDVADEGDEAGAWHVERVGTSREKCVAVPGTGSWMSVEFMRGDEYAVWKARRSGRHGEGDGRAEWWRGVI